MNYIEAVRQGGRQTLGCQDTGRVVSSLSDDPHISSLTVGLGDEDVSASGN